MQGNYSVAIDGPSGAGKSTIARAAAKRFGFLYVDTGAIYRTVGLAVERCGFEAGDEASVKALLPKLDISARPRRRRSADRVAQRRGRLRAYPDARNLQARVRSLRHALR